MKPMWAIIDDRIGCANIIYDNDTKLILWTPPYFKCLIGRAMNSFPKRIRIDPTGPLNKNEQIMWQFKDDHK